MSALSKSPIGAAEFGRAFRRAFEFHNSRFPLKPPFKLGLALSGGVDSTALAYLCKRIQTLPGAKPSDLELYGFVVDHGFRSNSAEEAKNAAENLQKILGQRPSILTLQWPDGVPPTEPRQFETRARILRLQALGRACHTQNVSALLFAQHEDDNHELLLLRLLQSSRAAGLRGMKPSIGVLECEGMHGVAASGAFAPSSLSARDPVQGFEQGGLRMMRPLLLFPKSRLVATCEAARLPWLEDPTNTDVTMTGRNAIRKVIGDGALPRALQKPALLSLMRACNENMEHIEALAEKLYKACVVHLFEAHVGSLMLEVPPLDLVFGKGYEKAWSSGLKLTVLSRLLRTLALLVTPNTDLQTRTFHSGAKIMFGLDGSTQPSNVYKPFTAGGVMFTRIETPKTPARGFRQWLVHREPLNPVVSQERQLAVAPRSSNDFRLWDGRYWIRIKNSTKYHLRITHTTRQMLLPFGKRLGAPQGDWLRELLKQIAPDRAKDTILSVQRCIGGKNYEVVALPTLGLSLRLYEGKVHTEVRYKRVDELRGFKPMKLQQLRMWVPPSARGPAAADPSKQPHERDGKALYAFRRESSLRPGPGAANVRLPSPHKNIARAWTDVRATGLDAVIGTTDRDVMAPTPVAAKHERVQESAVGKVSLAHTSVGRPLPSRQDLPTATNTSDARHMTN